MDPNAWIALASLLIVVICCTASASYLFANLSMRLKAVETTLQTFCELHLQRLETLEGRVDRLEGGG
jgi:hypothetical protein